MGLTRLSHYAKSINEIPDAGTHRQPGKKTARQKFAAMYPRRGLWRIGQVI